MALVHPPRDPDIGKQPNATDDVERDPTPDQPGPLQPLVTVRQQIVEEEFGQIEAEDWI